MQELKDKQIHVLGKNEHLQTELNKDTGKKWLSLYDSSVTFLINCNIIFDKQR